MQAKEFPRGGSPRGPRRTSAAVRIALVALGNLVAIPAHAQNSTTLGDGLNAFISMVEEQCRRLAPDAAEPSQRRTQAFMCGCQLQRTRALIGRLSEERLAEPIHEQAQFLAVLKPNVVEPCAGEMMRSMLAGEDCAAMKSHPGQKVDTARFCPCMKQELAAFSDADAAAVGLEAAQWIPAAAEAKKTNRPMPPHSELFGRLHQSARKCGAPGFLPE